MSSLRSFSRRYSPPLCGREVLGRPASCFAAKSHTSCVIFMLQNFGPHMGQKCAVLAPSAERVCSWDCSAVSGSRLRLN